MMESTVAFTIASRSTFASSASMSWRRARVAGLSGTAVQQAGWKALDPAPSRLARPAGEARGREEETEQSEAMPYVCIMGICDSRVLGAQIFGVLLFLGR